ncbi:hypothetical protein F4U02_13295 [Acinetobacter haemolyticus]|uniref:hypothetical protein n=1 Tax=Acinetobacter haemolyticus TaxID=29430 RepID=UPI0012987F35|nr:hypothetical protein [Acinetobacter haemolyticus]MQZ31960.1 hypothetical protein [Acinetobacter haemolyticus]
MNRKQKKAKWLNATAHTKKQANVHMTPKEVQDWNDYKIWDDELIEISNESKAFISKVRIAMWFVFIVVIILIIHHFGVQIWT